MEEILKENDIFGYKTNLYRADLQLMTYNTILENKKCWNLVISVTQV